MSSHVAWPGRSRDGVVGAGAGSTSAWLRRLDASTTDYYVLIAVVVALTSVGLVMVLSASSILSLKLTDFRSAYSIFWGQALFAVLGTVGLLVASRIGVTTWKHLALPAFLGSLALQCLVFTSLGVTILGNRNWIHVAGFSIQPSELIKLGLVLLGGAALARKQRLLDRPGHIVVPFLLPIAAAAVGLILLGGDLGTTVVIVAIIGGMLFAAGVPLRYFVASFAVAAGLGAVAVMKSAHRLARFDVWLGRDTNPYGAALQTIHGRYALADGGWFGLGLGASREKWGRLPEAHNDFIFAIIGEELGLPGTWVVIGLFVALAWVTYGIATRSTDTFVRIASAGVMSWILVQAVVNIGSVIGLLPVVGVPLPLVSAGGSSLVTTMTALGVLLSFARAEPGCAKALAAKPSVVRRTLAVIPSRRPRARR